MSVGPRPARATAAVRVDEQVVLAAGLAPEISGRQAKVKDVFR
jgi:hypothetical protein